MNKILKNSLLVITILAISAVGLAVNFDFSHAANSNYCVKKNGINIYTASGQRLSACNRMYQMSSVKWSISKAVTYKYASGKETTLEKGTHKGLPYTQVNREYSRPEKIQEYMDAAVTGAGPVKGVDCASAAAYALRYATGNTAKDDTYMKGATSPYLGSCFLYDGMRSSAGTATTLSGANITYRNNLSKVGWYGNYTGYTNAGDTKIILEKLMASGNYSAGTVYENVYAKIRPGDVLVRYYKTSTGKISGHIMLATRVELSYNGKNVDPDKSGVYFIDQIEPGRSSYQTGETSSWRNDETYSKGTTKRNNYFTLRQLATEHYTIPVTAWQNTSDYIISYNANGGTGASSGQEKAQYVPKRLSTSMPTKIGHTFKGWKTTNDPVETVYQPGEYYFEERSEALKAIWEPNKCTIIYDANNGENAPENQVKTYGTNIKLSLIKPTREGYDFLGWATKKDSVIVDYLAGDLYADDTRILSSNATITLYAVWEKAENPDLTNVYRIFGNGRIDTSIKAADQLKVELGVDKFDNVVVATAYNFADALPGSYVAAEKNAPILLIDGDGGYDKIISKYINDNMKANGTVYILGGEGVVPSKWLATVETDNIVRLGGTNRYGTNLEILKAIPVEKTDTVMVCTGMNFADSLSASATGNPILLADDGLTAEQIEYLESIKGCNFCMIGGEGAVPESIADAIAGYDGDGEVDRAAGASRFETSIAVAEKFVSDKDPRNAVLAYGYNFPDGLSGGPVAYAMGAPLILTASDIPTEYTPAKEYMAKEGIKSGYILGGTALISDDVVRAIFGFGKGSVISLAQ